ncbi:MAG: 5-oxoprolinase [Rhodospirillaceae bacterium]|nr:5-oxoprolinase [Rhodospirillaceae bacterium]|tara:strand:+ start:6594 stop:8612 length:2019 start_codon:yes stop_codon:yes gene_type:complete
MNPLIQLELIRESLVAVVNEMRANIIHSSYAAIIYEGHDFSCALMSADGRQVAQGLADHPIHIFAVPYSTREVVRAFKDDIHEGDLFLHNDPYTGGTHLNDVLLLHPVFHDGKLALFAAMRCHWNDVGGMTPGSLSGRVKEIYQEGIRITPTRICEKGVMNQAVLDALFNNMRGPEERIGDFNAMLGTGRKAAEHLGRLFKRFGGNGLLYGVEALIDRSERQMRARISDCPDGDYFAEGYIESDGSNPEPLVVRLKLTVDGDSIGADFTGTSAQTNGPTNCGPAMAFNAVGTIVKAFLDPKTPINHGSFNPISVIAPEKSFINARETAPCGGMAEVKFLIDSVVAAAMGQVVPEMSVGDLKGGANHIHIAGPRDDGGTYIHYEWPAGGTGASAGVDGSNAVRSYNEGDFNSIQSVETVESQYPLRVERCEIRTGACGDGENRGGFGLRRDIRILDETAMLSVLSEKNVIPPYGVAGGSNGAANRFVVERDGDVIEPSDVPGKVSGFALRTDDIVREETAGGGGYGDPLTRNPEKVAEDIRLGYLTNNQAKIRYGVIVGKDGDIDAAATAKKRDALSTNRISATLEIANEDDLEGPSRRIPIPTSLVEKLDISEGDLIELRGKAVAPLRGWARVSDGQDAVIVIGPVGIKLLNANPGDTVEVRAVQAAPDGVL